ncbi:MAG: Fic family protein [Polaromonas sp.]|nr:Fic family protein [Polaromonas sp.]MBT9476969.1 Fic family protein [Polaromonas sp.]
MSIKLQKLSTENHLSTALPWLPAEPLLAPLLEQAHDLQQAAQRLAGVGVPVELRRLLRAMNAHDSLALEGLQVSPLDVERALRSGDMPGSVDGLDDAGVRRVVAYMDTQAALEARWGGWSCQRIWSAQMVRDIHQDLFARLPQADLVLPAGQAMVPGALRKRAAGVALHAAPAPAAVGGLLAHWGAAYGGVRRGELQLVAVAASHHRLAWIHPFPDGNGRVARLHTHLALGALGLTQGLWSPLRGFARGDQAYRAQLAAADADGSAGRAGQSLAAWVAYVLALWRDQAVMMSGLLDLSGMKDRIAACLAYEENVVRQGVRSASLRALHYLQLTPSALERSDFKALLGLGERLATAQVTALLKRGLLATDSPHGKLRFGVPQHALRFYFPGLWPQAEAGRGAVP